MSDCTRLHPVLCAALFAAIALTACNDDGGSDGDDPPSVTLQALAQPVSRSVTLTAVADDDEGVASVEFIADGAAIGSDSSAPYSVSWDTSSVSDGEHSLVARARDSAGQSADSAALTVTVANQRHYEVNLSGLQEVPPVETAAAGSASFDVHLATGAVSGSLSLTGLPATAAHIHDAYAGTSGDIVVGLVPDAGDPNRYVLPAGSSLMPAQVDRLLSGALYVNAHSAAHPGGEVRAQLSGEPVQVLFTELEGAQEAPPVEIAAAGVAATTLDLASGALVVHVNTSGVDDATMAHIHRGAPGVAGPVVVGLERDAANPAHWFATGAQLDAAGREDYAAGLLYVNVHTPAHPSGAIRGQILPPGADPDDTPPTVALVSPGVSLSGTVTLTATAADDRALAEVRFYAGDALIASDASEPYSASWNTTTVANGNVVLTAQAEDAAGHVTTSAPVTVAVSNSAPAPAPATTLSQLQTSVFSPRCSGCHNGVGSALPGSMNLSSAAATHQALVNVASLEVPALLRVEPGDPDNSYLIDKLEGTQAVGARMPLGGPFLDAAAVEQLRQWIAAGAQNN